jgi:hypothetical protein
MSHTRIIQDFTTIVGGDQQTSDEEWAAIQEERGT